MSVSVSVCVCLYAHAVCVCVCVRVRMLAFSVKVSEMIGFVLGMLIGPELGTALIIPFLFASV